MSNKLTALIKILVISAAGVFALQPLSANAAKINSQPTLLNSSPETAAIKDREILLAQNQPDYQFPFFLSLPEASQRLFFHHSGTTLDNWKFLRQVNFILGIGSFPEGTYPENQIYRDADLVDIFYRDTLAQQTLSDPTIRTRDLPNPFSDSLFEYPGCVSFGPPICGEVRPGKPVGK
ncbi:MAG: hypothetical protein QNJ38_23875 [Prochloraceae cyanobacterium]|nr:hypothetical protein [Prochloraceae cyanobacterium]